MLALHVVVSVTPPGNLINSRYQHPPAWVELQVYEDGIAVNALSPNRVVPTAGTLFHGLTTADSPDAEPATLMAEAALALCVQPPADADGNPGLTGRIAYSQDLLAELGISDVTTRP